MRTDLFDFELPAERIALRPSVPRDAARLLVVRPGAEPAFDDKSVRDLPDLLRPGDAVVVNDSKVIPARLSGRRIGRGETEPAIEATLHQRLDGSRWRAFAKPGKRLAVGDVIRFGTEGRVCLHRPARCHGRGEVRGRRGDARLCVPWRGARSGARRNAAACRCRLTSRPGGQPTSATATITRPCSRSRRGRSRRRPRGCISRPSWWRLCRRAGVALHRVTLHVGAGTFLPVKAADTADHRMHGGARRA